MASPSSLSSRNWSYNVFLSFHGPDVRKTLLSHLREQFKRNGITIFNDQKIERSATIGPSLTEAIRDSLISIVILSKKYASSSWCLNELVEMLECQKSRGQIVMTVFYGVEPSDVRKQTGKFGIAFKETCARKAYKERQKWRKALVDVGNIAGEDFSKWDSEAEMIKKIARDVSDKLNFTPSNDFEGMVGLEAHLRGMKSLLDLDYDGVKMVAITGPAGIGKTTIARALHSRLSNRFQLTCFVDNLRGSNPSGFDEYGLRLGLQQQLLSKIFNQDGIRICHQGVIKERLRDQRVFIILDDVNHIRQLEALAGDISWFGSGSRIVVTTENKELLQQHGINNTYPVGFPSYVDAIEILRKYACRQSYRNDGFEKLAARITYLCGNLPLGLSVVGSSLRGKKEDEWEFQYKMRRLESILDRDIVDVLRIGYESLDEYEQSLFLHIAVFFNYKDGDVVETLFAGNNLDVRHGLKILVNRSLIYISTEGEIVMHKLLQQMGRQAIKRQEPWRRSILIDAREICDVLKDDKGTRAVSGISFDISGIHEVSISANAFKRMQNIQFLRVYKSRGDGNDIIHIPEEMEFPPHLRLLDWEAYPSNCLPPTFYAKNLVNLSMPESKFEYLWQGAQRLPKLKELNLSSSRQLKELPDLSNATALEILRLDACESLVEIPSSFSQLRKLKKLEMEGCISLQVIPADLNLPSLEDINMDGCSQLVNFPAMSANIKSLKLSETAVEDLSASIRLCALLDYLFLCYNGNFKGLTHLPRSLTILGLFGSDIERIPDCIKDLCQLLILDVSGCRRLVSLPELPLSLVALRADDCDSLVTVVGSPSSPYAWFSFTNCFKLDQQTQRAIIQRGYSRLPGSEVPAEFEHRAKGNSLTIRLDLNKLLSFTIKVCVVVSAEYPFSEWNPFQTILCRGIVKGNLDSVEEELRVTNFYSCRKEHLVIYHSALQGFLCHEGSSDVVLEFSSEHFDIAGCGAQISNLEIREMGQEAVEDDTEHCDPKEEENIKGEKLAGCRSWIFLCFVLSLMHSNFARFPFYYI